jgi:hypothetical protein
MLVNCPISYICPICFAGPGRDGYFYVVKTISMSVPLKTIQTLKNLFDTRAIELPENIIRFLDTVTVKDVVDEITESICKQKYVAADLMSTVYECRMEIMHLFLRMDGVGCPSRTFIGLVK